MMEPDTAGSRPDIGGGATRRVIESIIDTINRAWLDGHPQDAAEHFHSEVVVLPPGFERRVTGRDACVQSYADFIRIATVEEFVPDRPVIDVFGDTAVALCPLRVRYRISGKEYHERGHEVLVLTCDSGRWMVAWRTASYHPVEDE